MFTTQRLKLVSQLALLVLALAVIGGCDKSKVDRKNFYSKDFSLASLNGDEGEVSVSDYRGHPAVVNFWASWCVPCRAEMPNLEEMWREYRIKGVVFIGINTMDERKGAKNFINDVGVTFVNLHDPKGEVARFHSVASLPVTLFVDSSGRIVKKAFGGFIGEAGEKTLARNVEEIIQ